ncbi:MAG: hypothetical protein GXP28_08595 [Planctomycetes bacterium]|nr:hypothetical protein [Planctomycetota bacterium]
MAHNEILEEIYATRDALLAEHGGDVHAYVESARKRALASGRPIAESTQQTIQCTGAAKPSELTVGNQSSPPSDP